MANELILIIEDNDKNRKLVRDVLQAKGYKTIEAETAEEGLKLAVEKSPALILMDIQLPGMNGIDARKILRSKPDTANIPVVAVTASGVPNRSMAWSIRCGPRSKKTPLPGSARSRHAPGRSCGRYRSKCAS